MGDQHEAWSRAGLRARWALAAGVLLAACGVGGPDREHVDALFRLDAKRFPAAVVPAVAALGAELFSLPVPLGGEASSCATCHDLSRHGQDGRSTGGSRGGALVARNVPTVFDAARQVAFGWDGLVPDLATMVQRELAQRLGIADDVALRAVVTGVPGLAARFAQTFPGEAPINLPNAARALAGHLGTLRSVGRWDRYVEGDDAALSARAREGLRVFLEVGCATCHGGRLLGGASSHKLGLAAPYATADQGRAAVTGVAADQFVFKAPTLRRAAHTAPYLHDGSVATLPEMVRLMGRHELGVELGADQVGAIVEFLLAVGDVGDSGG